VEAGFPKDHAQTKSQSGMSIQLKLIPLWTKAARMLKEHVERQSGR
jgi:hypothetical protein